VADALQQLALQAQRYLALDGIASRAAPDIADALRKELDATVGAGTDSYGAPWRLTADGERPLQHAADAIRIAAVGDKVIVRLTGPEARHHRGWARGGIARPVIPTGLLPPKWSARVLEIMKELFERETAA